MSYTYETCLDLGCIGEQDVEIHYTYRRGRPAQLYLRNGDPGYPEEPPEVEITAIMLALGKQLPIDLLPEIGRRQLDDLCQEVQEHHEEEN